MKTLRTLLPILVLALLAGGYLASQYFWFQGDPYRWTQMIDRPEVAWLSLLILLVSIGLSFVPDKGDGA